MISNLAPNTAPSICSTLRAPLVLAIATVLPACTQYHALDSELIQEQAFYGSANPDQTSQLENTEAAELARFSYSASLDCTDLDYLNLPANYRADRPLDTTHLNRPVHLANNRQQPLSPGDLIELELLNGEGFAGDYVIQPDGRVRIPHIDPVDTTGLDEAQLAEKIELALVREKLFLPATARASIHVKQWAPVEVTVSGAVFEPGRVRINDRLPEQLLEERIAAFGDFAPSRYLSEALRAASGVRPDAKLDQVLLIRDGWQMELDLSGIVLGQPSDDIPLIAGDHIIVRTTGCFQHELVKPSQITPRGFRVFLSNLVETAGSNSNAAVGRFSSNLPYGARLLQAAVSANCVGGTSWTNAPRKVLLASRNPLTGKTQVIERSVEKLVRQAHNDLMNPYLMPNDAVACYDSDVTNLRDVARSLADILRPLSLI